MVNKKIKTLSDHFRKTVKSDYRKSKKAGSYPVFLFIYVNSEATRYFYRFAKMDRL
jgi:hypothetical protein